LPATGADKDERMISTDSTASGVLSEVVVEAVGREARREDLAEVEAEAGLAAGADWEAAACAWAWAVK